MKIKDIEKNLKKESESIKVPDVYHRAKKAPINKLLSDPVHAFRRGLVVGMLVFVLAIFLVVALGLSALWLTPSRVSDEEYGYVRVSASSGDVYGFAVDKSGTVLAAIKEKSGGVDSCEVISAAIDKSVENAINDVYVANATDEVVVSAQFDTQSIASQMSQKIAVSIRAQGAANVTSRANDSTTRASLIAYVDARVGDEEVGASLEDIVRAYLSIAANA